MAALAAAEQETQEERMGPMEPQYEETPRPWTVPMEPWEAEWEIAEARFHEVVVEGRF